MRILTPLVAVALGFLCGCAHTSAPVADHYFRTVSFPRIALSDGERIESVEVVISCGRFTSIHRIPNDWSVEVISPVSEVSTFKATAGHGSTSLWSSRDFEDFITILVCEPSCFSIKGTATAFTADKERTIAFTESDFVMKPSPNKGAAANRRGRSPLNGSGNSTATLRSTGAVPAVAELGR